MIFHTNSKLVAAAILVFGVAFAAAEEFSCQSKCREQFKEPELEACNKGCDNYKNVVNYENIIDESDDENETLSLCKHSCQDAYPLDTKQVSACHQGCLDHPKTSSTPPTIHIVRPMSLLDNIFGGDDLIRGLDNFDGHRNGGLKITFGMPRIFMGGHDNINDHFGGMFGGHVGQMMQGMNNQMNQMMQSIHSRMVGPSFGPEPTFIDPENFSETHEALEQRQGASGGKMFIMESGPGYHNEKTYDIGPNGKMTLIKDDMMNHGNPLEKDNNQDDVEVFEPVETVEKVEKIRTPHQEEPFKFGDIFGKILQHLTRKPDDQQIPKEIELINNELFKTGKIDIPDVDRHIVEEFNIEPKIMDLDRRFLDLEKPILPKTGLRSRDMCYANSENLKWSEWASCLHMKLGIPRWVMTTSICMGIIFLLWLCLVIPSNAPKQRVRGHQQNPTPQILTLHPKEAEALAIVSETKKAVIQTKDLPPSYDDIANLSVKLEPVHEPITTEKSDKKSEDA